MGDQERRAVVLGAGIGGLTCAIALAERGWQVTVLERAAELGEVGAGISLWPAAMQVLDDLGVHELFRGEAALTSQSGLRRPDGRILVDVPEGSVAGPVMVHRARLHAALVERLGADRVHTGTTGVSVTPHASGAQVAGAYGTVFAGDLVVGADGLRSVTRTALHPSAPPIRHAGYRAYRGIAPVTVPSSGETWGGGARFGYAPLPDGRTYWYATANRPPGTASPDDHADVAGIVDGWHAPIAELVAATPTDSVLCNDVYDLPTPLLPFGSGHLALLGDAAHAMTPNLGQGACAAIEDAAALAAALDERPGIGDAVARYDAVRRPVAQRLLTRSRWLGRIGQFEHPAALTARDALLATAGRAARMALRLRRRR